MMKEPIELTKEDWMDMSGMRKVDVPPRSLCFSTAVQDLFLKSRVLTPRGGPQQHGVPVLHPCHHRARENLYGPDKSREWDV